MFVHRDIVYERIEFEGDANHSVQVSHFHGHTEKLVATFLIRIDRQILPGQLLQFGTYVRLLFGDL